MQKLLEQYKAECAIKCNTASTIWKVGIIIISTLYMILSYVKQAYSVNFILFLIGILILYLMCLLIFKYNVLKKIYPENNNIKKIKNLYIEIDKYQKNWITIYCKKNKINQISKLDILRKNLSEKRKNKAIRYINPIIIGTLIFTIWEIGLQKLSVKIGFANMIFVAIVLATIISISIGILKKEFIENKEIFLEFDKYADDKRLEDLLLYEILNCKK